MMIAGVLCQAIVVSLPTVSRFVDCLLHPTCDIRHLNHLTVVFALLIVCAITFAGHMPESIWPGQFDVLGHGHQWFHVTVVLAMLAQVWAIDIDVTVVQTASQLNQPGAGELMAFLVALVVLETATFLFYMRLVVFRRLSKDIPRQLVIQSIRKQLGMLSERTSESVDHKDGFSGDSGHTVYPRNGEGIIARKLELDDNKTTEITGTHKKRL